MVMFRAALITALLSLPSASQAWQASLDNGLCRLDHSQDGAEVTLTFDPSQPLYSITITRQSAWPDGPVFAMRFQDRRPIFIQTDRHIISADGLALTVTDRGFGNVLDGLQFNDSATALLADFALPLSLTGAAEEVQAFRNCATAPSA